MKEETSQVQTRNLDLYYGQKQALKNISLDIFANKITAFIGPSGCGKSTFLRTLNRMNDLIGGVNIKGEVVIDGVNIYDGNIDIVELRRKVGMVFQKPNLFPKSIYDNLVFGPKLNGIKDKKSLTEIVERTLRQAAIWDEVRDRLHENALSLSGGQQQRLCIARALAVDPEIILLDEPASALDPISTAKIEDLLVELKHKYTIIIVTHNMQQASRVSDYTAFFYMGELIEYGATRTLFTKPSLRKTEEYITGRFG
ncbi:MAG: phosphate ABC transporter ATP-binding protein PstB [Ignavibacteriales bacterium]